MTETSKHDKNPNTSPTQRVCASTWEMTSPPAIIPGNVVQVDHESPERCRIKQQTILKSSAFQRLEKDR